MSLIGCILWQTQMNTMSSDLEDEFAKISDQLHEMTKQGGSIGEELAQYKSERDRACNYINGAVFQNQFNQQNPQNFTASQQYQAEAENYIQKMNSIIEYKENQKELMGAEEKHLMARKNSLETRKKLADQDAQSAASLKDKAIERNKINV